MKRKSVVSILLALVAVMLIVTVAFAAIYSKTQTFNVYKNNTKIGSHTITAKGDYRYGQWYCVTSSSQSFTTVGNYRVLNKRMGCKDNGSWIKVWGKGDFYLGTTKQLTHENYCIMNDGSTSIACSHYP